MIPRNLEPCDGGWRTHLSTSGEGGDALIPSAVGEGWLLDNSSKPGWLFNASAMKRVQGGPIFAPLTFDVNFGVQPKLVLSFMRSYANFGRAVVWFDEARPTALDMLTHHHRFTTWCNAGLCSNRAETRESCFGVAQSKLNIIFGDEFRKSAVYALKDNDPALLDCQKQVIGELQLSFLLEGRWSDQSSQMFYQGMQSGISRSYAANTTKVTVRLRDVLSSQRLSDVIRDPETFVGYAPNPNLTLSTPGRHLVHIAMLREAKDAIIDERPLFKVMGLMAC